MPFHGLVVVLKNRSYAATNQWNPTKPGTPIPVFVLSKTGWREERRVVLRQAKKVERDRFIAKAREAGVRLWGVMRTQESSTPPPEEKKAVGVKKTPRR